MKKICIFSLNNLHISKKSSTFAVKLKKRMKLFNILTIRFYSQITIYLLTTKIVPIMKKIKAIKNLIDCLNENNFLNMYFVADYVTDKRLSMCFLKKDVALAHMQWLMKNNTFPNVNMFYIGETCVYCG